MDEIEKKNADAASAIESARAATNGKSRRALVTGITGQDGAYLAAHLLASGYAVAGLVRRSTGPNPIWRLSSLLGERVNDVALYPGDLLDSRSIDSAIDEFQPTHVFNLAAQSFVGTSFTEPEHTMQVTGYGAVRVFESCVRLAPKGVRVYQASSSEMFGVSPAPQREETVLSPCSPYGCAKVYAHQMANVFRNAYGLHVSCGILFNHESPLRGREFVTQSIALQIASCVLNGKREIRVGNLSACRDWGFAGDFVRAMEMMTNAEEPGDFVIATGRTKSVGDFLSEALFTAARLRGDDASHNALAQSRVVVDPSLVRARPYEVPVLLGDFTKAKQVLGWRPMTTFEELVEMMMVNAFERVSSYQGVTANRAINEAKAKADAESALH